MSAHDLPGLTALLLESRLVRAAWSSVEAIARAAHRSEGAERLRALRALSRTISSSERLTPIGLMLMAAALTHLVISAMQPPHQAPVAAPVLSAVVMVLGVLLITTGHAWHRAWSTSKTAALWRWLTR